ncbi:MAG: DUF420 domain-containing protein [Verrucomicrobiota bacterium]
MSVSDLPAVNAAFNGLSAVLLGVGYYCIRRGKVAGHRRSMMLALTSSALFLAGYLTYHFSVKGVTHFRDPAWFRPIYLGLLASHTLLAAAILPLILVTVGFAMRGRFDRHRAWARWTWPLWMYVSVTGVVIYVILYRLCPQHN